MARQPSGLLRPSKLFSKSLRGRTVELLASAAHGSFTPGNHRCFIGGTKGGGGLTSDVARLSGTPDSTAEEIFGEWKTSYWYYQSDYLLNTVDDCTHRWFREFLTHGTVWTGVNWNSVHQSQRLAVKPLKPSRWPSDPLGPSWPSFPSIVEWMEMCRKGIDPFARPELEEPEGNAGFTRVTMSEVKENPFLATRIVSNAIVGIRSSMEVPAKWLRYFHYGRGFLILTASVLPIGLVRFLLGQWCTKPYSLWLRRSSTLKKFLRKVPSLHVSRARARLASGTSRVLPAENGSCTPTSCSSSDYESGGESGLD